MELINLWIFSTIIVLLNLIFGGLFSIFLLILVISCAYIISKLCLSPNHTMMKQLICEYLLSISDSGKKQGFHERFEKQGILKFLKTRERDEIYYCFICQERRCLRHGPEVKVKLFHERRILINSCLNRLLTDIINLCLEDVESLKNNDNLCQEVRRCISFVTGNLMTRVKMNIDSSEFIIKRLSTLLVQHLYFFLKGKRQARSAYFIREQVIKVYRENGYYCDSNYLHSLVKSCHHLLLSPTLLSNSTLALFSLELIVNCVLEPFLDLISNPYYFNTFIILLLEGLENVSEIDNRISKSDTQLPNNCQPNTTSSQSSSPGHNLSNVETHSFVQLLESFSSPSKELNRDINCLGLSLKKIIQDEQLLFIFMQYLKEEGSVNLLQFLLSVDAFNCRLLKPDLTEEEKSDLTKELELIFQEYFDEESPDYIHFRDVSIKKTLENVIERKEVVLLQTSDPLYKAYDQVYNTIDCFYLPLFSESSLYFKLVAGSRSNQSASFDANDGDNVSLSSQISSIPDTNKKSLNEEAKDKDSFKEENEKIEEDIQVIHDLSSWQVKVDRVDKRVKNEFDDDEIDEDDDRLVYFIKVNNVQEETSWVIQREFDEFHVLQSKLRQFHGNIKGIDFQLPKKRVNLFSSSSYFPVTQTNISFLESHLGDLQIFLETLLSNPALQFSSLLHSFLNPSSSSNQFNSTSVDFKKMIRNLNSSFSLKSGNDLRTSLQPFIISFLNSTENKRNMSSNDKETNYGVKSNSNSFEDALDSSDIEPINDGVIVDEFDCDGKGNSLYELILFIMNCIYGLDESNSQVYQLFKLLEPLSKDLLQSLMTGILESALKNAISLDNCILALETLKSTLKARKSTSDVNEEEKLRKMREGEALKALQAKLNYVPFTPSSLSFHLYYCFQFPQLNKQFLYLILGQLFLLLFPEVYSN